jgi:hypothetical protein
MHPRSQESHGDPSSGVASPTRVSVPPPAPRPQYARAVTQAFVYENHVTSIPGWVAGQPDLPLGYAYETPDYNVHIFGARGEWWTLSRAHVLGTEGQDAGRLES